MASRLGCQAFWSGMTRRARSGAPYLAGKRRWRARTAKDGGVSGATDHSNGRCPHPALSHPMGEGSAAGLGIGAIGVTERTERTQSSAGPDLESGQGAAGSGVPALPVWKTKGKGGAGRTARRPGRSRSPIMPGCAPKDRRAFAQPGGKRRWRARTPKPGGVSGATDHSNGRCPHPGLSHPMGEGSAAGLGIGAIGVTERTERTQSSAGPDLESGQGAAGSGVPALPVWKTKGKGGAGRTARRPGQSRSPIITGCAPKDGRAFAQPGGKGRWRARTAKAGGVSGATDHSNGRCPHRALSHPMGEGSAGGLGIGARHGNDGNGWELCPFRDVP